MSDLNPVPSHMNPLPEDNVRDDDPLVVAVYQQAKQWVVDGGPVGPATIISFATYLMCVVQKSAAKGSGPYKKKVVLTVIRRVVAEIDFASEADRAAVVQLVNTLVPPAIDAIKEAGTNLAAQLPTTQTKCPCC